MESVLKYLGNKQRLQSFIGACLDLDDRQGQTGVDAFCGTGAVSALFKKAHLNTYSNDFLACSYHHTKAVLMDDLPHQDSLLSESGIFLPHLDPSQRAQAFIHQHYSENAKVCVFRNEIAEYIDGNRKELEQIKPFIWDDHYSYYLAQIINAADFRSNIMGSYESFYKRGWRKQCDAEWCLQEINIIPNDTNTFHHVYNLDVLDFLQELDGKDIDFIYLDPPYNSRQYSAVFHVLETIALWDEPKIAGTNNKRVGYKKSPFSSKREVAKAFDKLLKVCSQLTQEIFISYSTEGIISVEKIVDISKEYYNKSNVFTTDYRRFKTNSRTQRDANLKEVIIQCKN